MRRLPFCDYPAAADIDQHGLQPLPDVLPLVTIDKASAYRSQKHRAIIIDWFNEDKVLRLAKMLAKSFAVNEPMARYIHPPLHPPANVDSLKHADPFGVHCFGEWTKENILYWVVRLFILTDQLAI